MQSYINTMRNLYAVRFFSYFCPQNELKAMNFKRPFILVSNDDGYHAKGINCLIDMLSDMADLLVCAPEYVRSGYSCAFSAATPLRLKLRRESEGYQMWSCNGTPVDCVKLAFSEFCRERKPDLVIGGINHGDNASVNTHYSGTMGVAMEGCMKGVPSVAFSLANHDSQADFEPLRPYVRQMVEELLRTGLPDGVCLNVNFPAIPSFKGVRMCRMARGEWINECSKSVHPFGYDYFWMAGSYSDMEPESRDTDSHALREGYVAVTPTRLDVTDYDMLNRLRAWETMMPARQ